MYYSCYQRKQFRQINITRLIATQIRVWNNLNFSRLIFDSQSTCVSVSGFDETSLKKHIARVVQIWKNTTWIKCWHPHPGAWSLSKTSWSCSRSAFKDALWARTSARRDALRLGSFLARRVQLGWINYIQLPQWWYFFWINTFRK